MIPNPEHRINRKQGVTMNTAAIILAAGRGTRMHDDTLNKVCFECAGIPVVRRIVLNMKEAGVTQFVVLVGHKPKDVMDALDGIDGIVYVYQKVQNGTGHAALLGMKALQGMGYHGNANGDRVSSRDGGEWPMRITDEYLIRRMEEEAELALQPGAYGCSLPEIDALCDMLNATDGVLGSQMLGAGLGGCLAALVEAEKAEKVIDKLNKEYYDIQSYEHSAQVYRPLGGSKVIF